MEYQREFFGKDSPMTISGTLFLHHEVMLLALHPTRGTVIRGTQYSYAMGGAVLAELLLNKRISLKPSRKTHLVEAVSAEPLGEPLIDRCLEKINGTRGYINLPTWISRVAGVRNLRDHVAQQLCKRDILKTRYGRVMLIFSRRIYLQTDPEPKRELIERLRNAIFTDAMHLDPRTVILLSIANGTGLLSVVFDKKELSARQARIEQLISGEIVGNAIKRAVKVMQTAIVAP
jgi:golgi phosphoprotein 3